MLLVPGDRPERFSKALATSADLVCIDLEDAVPPEAKVAARAATVDFLTNGPLERVAVRINSISTRSGMADLLALTQGRVCPPRIVIPKVESAAQLAVVIGVLADTAIGFLPAIETAEGLANAPQIARTPRCAALIFGGADLAADLGVPMEWEPLLVPRSMLVQACARARIPAFDVPHLDLHDTAALEDETRRVKTLGFEGKIAIHPRQVETINRVYQPTEQELSEAQEAVASFEAAGGAAIQFRGRLLELPLMNRYKRILATARGRQ
jgi:citrate lyase beta subunit